MFLNPMYGLAKIRTGLAALPLLLLSASAWAQPPDGAADRQLRQSLERITAVFHQLSTNLADPVDTEKALYEGAIAGMLERLDPFSTYLNRQQLQSFEQQQRGVRQGFGAILNVQAGKVTVLQSVPNSPFGRAGIGPGDRIVNINGHRVASMDLQELVEVLEAARSGKVRLSILQGGRVVPQDFELDPAEVPSPTVDKHFLVAPRIGYLHVARIEPGTPAEIRAALEEWSGALDGLVLDLRDNPGGVVDAAVETVGLFLPDGSPVVSLRGRNLPQKTYSVTGSPAYPTLPMVVVVNQRTASAAEIISAALQEHDRAWLVGETSFGKGVVESVLPLSDGALVLTTARYLTPRGRSVQKPLPGTALAGILEQGSGRFFTDKGRPIAQSGGVEPDQKEPSWPSSDWVQFLQQSTGFINFAQDYLERNGRVSDGFVVDDGIAESFRGYLAAAGVRVPAREWQQALPFIRARIETEIYNLVFGAAKGDEVETKADPQVKAAVAAMPRAAKLIESVR